ncbi:caspase family protein [Candidatus Parabeggiatoa sp. HSG14]|uniref:caspase family protein n=1 Tax=Candidatus Parabeggiatoa sp. HSG14 TaxID=3055593 RepID=UPI0025A87612|nr:caspase family protein [Thiotrichales bacterium HSG14]
MINAYYNRFFLLPTFYILCLIGLCFQQGYASCSLSNLKSTDQIALLIANGKYTKGTIWQPINDANAMKEVLTEIGFRVIFRIDLDKKAMRKITREFRDCLRETHGIGLFYFTGYGMQLNGKNYLLPINADMENEIDEIDVEEETFDVYTSLFRRLEKVKNELNIIILDASRDSPYPKFGKKIGLAHVSFQGSCIAYPTEADKTILEQNNQNSLYISTLVAALKMAVQNHTRVEDVFMQVADDVLRESKGQQEPKYSSSLKKSFYFGCLNQKASENWIADRNTGCKVNSTDRTPNDEITWSGKCVNCIAQGKGILIKYRYGRQFQYYKGQVHRGLPHGRGFLRQDSGSFKGDRFEGEFRNGKLSNGNYISANGDRVKFRDGQPVQLR